MKYIEIIITVLAVGITFAAAGKTTSKTPCYDLQDEIIDSGDMETHIPHCETDGRFEAMQVHHETATCYCVNPDNNELIPGTSMPCDGFPLDCTTAKSKCSKDRAHALATGAKFVPTCDAGGYFKTTQCNLGKCWCVEAKKGGEIPETRMSDVSYPINCDKLPSVCEMRNIKSKYVSRLNNRQYTCDAEGYFAVKQCDDSQGKCWCVNKHSGDLLIGTQQPKTQFTMNCTDHRSKCERESVDGFPSCYKRFYRSKQCQGTDCWCVNKEFGNEIEGTRMPKNIHEVDCEKRLETCLLRRAKILSRGFKAKTKALPICEADGTFQQKQCFGHILGGFNCWCVDKFTGVKDKESITPSGVELSCPDRRTKCQREHARENNVFDIIKKGPRFFITQCTADGKYARKQCYLRQPGVCWCVNPMDGAKTSDATPGRNC